MTKRKFSTTRNFTTTIVNHLLKVFGLVVSHSVFSPFHSRTPIMLNLKKFKMFFTRVNDWTNCPAIQGFDRTKPIFDWTLSVDRPLFQALQTWTISHILTLCYSLSTFCAFSLLKGKKHAFCFKNGLSTCYS